MTDFKECFECAKKPGSPTLCHQCLWVRSNYKPPQTDNNLTWNPHNLPDEIIEALGVWTMEGRTEEQIYGVKNFLTGKGGYAISQRDKQLAEEIINALESNPDIQVNPQNIQHWIELKQAQLRKRYL